MEQKKVLFVAGASSDIGVELIGRVADNYDLVLCHYRSNATPLAALSEKFGEKIVPLQADFASEGSTKEMIETIATEYRMPDHFVHLSASTEALKVVKFHKIPWKVVEDELSIALRSAVMLGQAFLPSMAKNNQGKMIFMLSNTIVKHPSIKHNAPYVSVKYALLGLMKALSAEYADKNIAINAVSPSAFETKFLRSLPDVFTQMQADASPIKRNLFVSEVVPTFEFLLSSGADRITGQNIGVTAGN